MHSINLTFLDLNVLLFTLHLEGNKISEMQLINNIKSLILNNQYIYLNINTATLFLNSVVRQARFYIEVVRKNTEVSTISPHNKVE